MIIAFVQFFRVYELQLSFEKANWTLFSDFIAGPINTIVSLGTLAITSLIAYSFGKHQIKQDGQKEKEQKRNFILNLFKEFRNEDNLKARKSAWEFKKIWDKYSSPKDRDLMITAMINFQRRIFTDKNGTQDELLEEHIDGVYHLFDFYRMLVAYKPDPQSIQASNYFFYEWWRKFLYEVAKKYDAKRTGQLCSVELQGKENFDFENFKQNILFKPHLKELDDICGFVGLNAEDEIYGTEKK